ncbi:MAG: thioredoxin domain-containing protein [Candidatus Paceibacterota bacterium]|jgi:protein-disulfide isomerase
MKPSFTIPIAIVLGGIMVAGAVYLSMRQPSTFSGTGNPALVRLVSSSDHILGNPAAPVIIVEYSDFDCTFCKGFNETMRQIIANEGASGKVAWVFRHLPITEIYPNAFSHARAAECAAQVGGNDAFWKFENALFMNQPINPANYGTLASSVGISSDSFATCVSSASPAIDARINADRQNALDVGAQGTPYSLVLIQGRAPIVMDGAYPYDAIKQLIDRALAQ